MVKWDRQENEKQTSAYSEMRKRILQLLDKKGQNTGEKQKSGEGKNWGKMDA